MPIPIASTTAWMYGPAGGVTTLPPGDTVLTDTLVIENQFGPVLNGAGKFLSRIVWNGPPDRPVVALKNCNQADIGSFTMVFRKPAKDAIVCTNLPSAPPGTVASSRNYFHDIWLEAGTSGGHYVRDCIRIDSSYYGGPDQNNELHRIERCKFAGFSGAAVGIYSSQSHLNIISDCQMSNSGAAMGTAVHAMYGSQTMKRCNGGNLELVFFGSDQYAGAGRVIDNNFEGCNRFVDCRLPNGTWIIEGNRCDGMTPYNCTYGDINHVASYVHAYGSTTFKNNMFGCYNGGTIQTIFAGAIGLNCSGNTYSTNSTTPAPVMLTTQSPVLGPIAYWQNNRWTQGQPDGRQVTKQLVMPANTNVGLAQTTPQ